MADTVYESLSEADCEQLLAAAHFGRLAVVTDEGPEIFPVNYVWSSGRVAIRTDPGTKLTAATLARVAFEIDQMDPVAKTGWSVLVKGTGFDVTDSIDTESEDLRRLTVETLVPGDRIGWIRIEPSSVTGRRIRPA